MPFPKDFVWGAAAAAYQIEGAANEADKGPSVWDMFCKKPGAILHNHTGEQACDHYHRYRQDAQLMRQIGLQAYRLSVSWPRVLPSGTGPVSEAGLSFYDRLIDSLLEARIEPYVTLFHWDLPLALYHRGSWLNRDSSEWFSDYAAVVVDRLSDRVKHWMTFNEPSVFLHMGYQTGVHAPGDKLRFAELTRAAHHILLAHGKAVQVIRARSKRACRVGFAPAPNGRIPHTESDGDVAAAKQVMFGNFEKNISHNGVWLDPVFFGGYPDGLLEAFGHEGPAVESCDLEIIHQPLDFFGVNVYGWQRVKAKSSGKPEPVPYPAGYPNTALGWPVTPDALYWAARLFHDRYRKPIYVTENGLSLHDWVSVDGQVHDPQRIDFMTRHLSALRRAGEHGAELAGYFHWSVLDNFEWAEGYRERFGLVYVDYQSQRRILKDSALFYSEVIRSHGENIPVLPATVS